MTHRRHYTVTDQRGGGNPAMPPSPLPPPQSGHGIHCGQLILRKINKIGATDVRFKAKMNQIRFPLVLCPRPRWGAYSAPQTS